MCSHLKAAAYLTNSFHWTGLETYSSSQKSLALRENWLKFPVSHMS